AATFPPEDVNPLWINRWTEFFSLVLRRFGGAGPTFGVRGRVVAQRLPAAVNAAAHGAQLHAQGGTDLLVGQTFDVTQHDRGTKLRRQRITGGLQVRRNT